MRICLFGGPGCGKSLVAAKLFYKFKEKGKSIELVREYIKDWTYEDRKPQEWDQGYIFEKQKRLEALVLRNGQVKNIVTDSPLYMQIAYGIRYGYVAWQEMLSVSKKFDSAYPSLNIFLDRTEIPYDPIGRWEDAAQAKEMDNKILNFLDVHVGKYVIFPTMKIDEKLEEIESYLD